MTPSEPIGLLEQFNKIYEEKFDEKEFEIHEKPCFNEVYETLVKFDLPTLLFQKNLKSLKLLKSDELDNGVEGLYLPKVNKLIYKNPKCLNHELFHVASASGKETTGVVLTNKNGVCLGTCLNEGITDMFSKQSNPDCPTIYPFEKMCATCLMFMHGPKIFKPYFQNNGVAFVSQFDKMIILELMDNLDKYSNSITKIFTSLEQEKLPNPNDLFKVSMRFHKVLESLAVLYYKSDISDANEFRKFISESLCAQEMSMIMNIVTRFGLEEAENYQRLF